MKIEVYWAGTVDIILDANPLIIDAMPTKLRMEAARSSKYVLIFAVDGSSSWLTIFRSSMTASYNLLFMVFLIAPSAVLSGTEISARGKHRTLSRLTHVSCLLEYATNIPKISL